MLHKGADAFLFKNSHACADAGLLVVTDSKLTVDQNMIHSHRGLIRNQECGLAAVGFGIKNRNISPVAFGQRTTKIKVLDVREFTAKADAASMYEVIS